MHRKLTLLFALAGLVSCGTINEDGSAATGPLGQQLLMTEDVQAATRLGIAACADALTVGRSLSDLQSQGFTPWRGGYRVRIDNPRIIAGDSSVSVSIERGGECVVATKPTFPVEIQTMQSLTAETLAGRGAALDVRFGRQTSAYEGGELQVIMER